MVCSMVNYFRTYFDGCNTRVAFLQDYKSFKEHPIELLFEKAKYENENGVELILDNCERHNDDTLVIDYVAKSSDLTRPDHLVRSASLIIALKWARIGFAMLQYGEVAARRYKNQCVFRDYVEKKWLNRSEMADTLGCLESLVDYYATLYYTVAYRKYMDLEAFTEVDDVDFTSLLDEYRREIARINLGGQDYD